MSRIEIITASAGSGKTTKLTQVLAEALDRGEARPDAVVATTFTNKAAAELQERARQKLLAAGRTADAHRLGAARIGTVNAVCGRLVDEFAFELRLPPDIEVIDDTVAAETLYKALASAVPPVLEKELADLKSRLEAFEWAEAVRRVVELSRTNGVNPKDLGRDAERSAQSIAELFGDPVSDGSVLDRGLLEALDRFIAACDSAPDDKATTAKAVSCCREARERLRGGGKLAWREWASLASLKVAKASEGFAAGVRKAAGGHDRHPALLQDLKRAIELTFQLARNALENYQQQKRRWGVVDFVDQEVFALQLLRTAGIRERLAGEIDLVLVDEFQDTSPLQLAIFVELAKIAPRSVWVGDQKQAIFGFRGTDPALMNAAIESLLGGSDPQLLDNTVGRILEAGEPATLALSWRSRPDLVRLTSAMFARAFQEHGIPEERVRLKPAREEEPAGLGPVVEHWSLRLEDKRRTTELGAAVAAGVRDLLQDETTRVRDTIDGRARRPLPGDVAVLCRTNAECDRVANALEALGVRAEVPRAGLLKTIEGRTALAGLTLWLDPRNRLAAAELARVTDYPDREDEWLDEVLSDDRPECFDDVPVVRAIRQAKAAFAGAGPLEALDRFMAVCGLRTLARRWGEDAARVANLDAFRAHAVRYVQTTQSRRLPATVAGLVRYLRHLAEFGFVEGKKIKPGDSKAIRSDGNAVVVSTWHRAKGLEWPITVLFGLEKIPPRNALGVQVAADWSKFDVDNPLEGRWVRYWLSPYSGAQLGTPFRERLAEHPENLEAEEQDRREQLRMLYVGWTRARDRLVLAAMEGKLLKGLLGQLEKIDTTLITTPQEGQPVTWGGETVDVQVRSASPQPPEPRSLNPGQMVVPKGPSSHPPAVVVPSSLSGRGEAGDPERIGRRLTVRGDPNMSRLGNAVHGFLAADNPDMAVSAREAMAAGLLRRWDVADAMEPGDLLGASDSFHEWCLRRWPDARRSNEVPVYHRLDDGSVVRGVIDVLLDTGEGGGIVDHKTFPGGTHEALQRAAEYAGQLRAYRAAVIAARGEERHVWVTAIHLPVLGQIIPV